MKNINKLFYIAFFGISVFSTSCGEPEDHVTANAKEGGIIFPASASNNYVVGSTEPYVITFRVEQGPVKITSVDVYKTFSTKVFNEETEVFDTKTSNEVLLTTVPVTETVTADMSFETNFTELRADLEVDGQELPTDDGQLSIGDNWVLRFVSTLDDGRKVTSAANNNVKFTVATRYAGKYNVIAAAYWRIGVNRPDVVWPAQFTIESVDAITYRLVDYFGPFSGNQLYFTINGAKEIDYPATHDGVAQSGNGIPLTTCDNNLGDLLKPELCTGSNIVIDDNVGGKDKLLMTYSYVSPNGPREFYSELEKIVE